MSKNTSPNGLPLGDVVDEFSLGKAIRQIAKSGISLTPSTLVMHKRRAIQHPTEKDFIGIICEGWAAASISLYDGRRQIVLFLLPGDIVSPENLHEPISKYRIESISDVTYCKYKTEEFRNALFYSQDMFEAFTAAWANTTRQLAQLAADLGRGTAEERISRLILNLMGRLNRRGILKNGRAPFPLRQHHIADATGLTPVYVSEVLRQFHRDNLINVSGRSLTIINEVQFRRVANI